MFDEFKNRFQARFDAQHFFEGKLAEQQARHARFDDSAYKLEPNLKDSPGGLRDLHTIHWLTQACGIAGGWTGLARANLLTRTEARRIEHVERSLSALRIHLHLLAKRREDRLAFDYQTELAAQLGLTATEHKRAGEHLMQGYYRAAKLIQRANDILIQSLRVRLFPVTAPPEPLDEDFQVRANLLEARDPELFKRKPDALLRAFILYAQHPQLAGFEPATLRALWRGRTRINAAFRANPAHRALFMTLLRQPHGVTRALRAMHRYGLLGCYIPAFGRIVGQMQHDLFHVYTVDEHILTVLRNVRRFTVPALAHEFPLASKLITAFDKPELLYLAALFHDIAKGRGGDHSELGMADALRFCSQHELDKTDSELVAWLVGMHLVMSRTSQKEDISDPEVISAFTAKVGSTRRLTALYLLTVADIRGTSPKVWNAWKGKLLEDLYHAAQARLAGDEDAASDIATKQSEARINLALYGLPNSAADALWQHLDTRYFTRFDAREMAWQARMLWRHTDKPQRHRACASVACWRRHPGAGLHARPPRPVCTDLRLFRTHPVHHSRSQDPYHPAWLRAGQLSGHGSGQSRHSLPRFPELCGARTGARSRSRTPLQPPPRGRLSRHQRHHPYPTTVRLEADAPGYGHMLSITCPDRGGLLFEVAEVLMRNNVGVYTAKIDTLGERVEDTFLIRGEVLQDPAKTAALIAEVREVLK